MSWPSSAQPSRNGAAGGSLSSNGATIGAPASYYAPVVDRPSLLDLPVSSPPLAPVQALLLAPDQAIHPSSDTIAGLQPMHSLLDIDWTAPTPGAGQASAAFAPAALPLLRGSGLSQSLPVLPQRDRQVRFPLWFEFRVFPLFCSLAVCQRSLLRLQPGTRAEVCFMMQHADNGGVLEASSGTAAIPDDRPRNGWASLGKTVSASLTETGSSLLSGVSPTLTRGSSQLGSSQPSGTKGLAKAGSSPAYPIGRSDPLAALDPFADLGSWSSLDSKGGGSPGGFSCRCEPDLSCIQPLK